MAFKFKRALTAGGENAIHILGIGNLGKYVAHALMKQNPRSLAPITLLFHRKRLLADWNNGGRVIQCITHGKVDRRGGFKVEVLPDSDVDGTLDATPIKNLIVATKSYATASALDLIKHRLNKESNMIFLQNGMGKLQVLVAEPGPVLTIFQGLWTRSPSRYSPIPWPVQGTGPVYIALVVSTVLHRSTSSIPAVDLSWLALSGTRTVHPLPTR